MERQTINRRRRSLRALFASAVAATSLVVTASPVHALGSITTAFSTPFWGTTVTCAYLGTSGSTGATTIGVGGTSGASCQGFALGVRPRWCNQSGSQCYWGPWRVGTAGGIGISPVPPSPSLALAGAQHRACLIATGACKVVST